MYIMQVLLYFSYLRASYTHIATYNYIQWKALINSRGIVKAHVTGILLVSRSIVGGFGIWQGKVLQITSDLPN